MSRPFTPTFFLQLWQIRGDDQMTLAKVKELSNRKNGPGPVFTSLVKAGVVERTSRGTYELTELGRTFKGEVPWAITETFEERVSVLLHELLDHVDSDGEQMIQDFLKDTE